MESEEVNDEDSLASPTNPTHVLDSEPAMVDSGDLEDDISRNKTANGCTNDKTVEEPAECAEDELGKLFLPLYVVDSPSDQMNRAPCKGLDLPYLCILQANPEHRPHQWAMCSHF